MRRFWPVLVASLAGLALLLNLGFWQLRRLEQKEALLAAIDERIAAAPISLQDVLKRDGENQDIEYLKVRLQGQYISGPAFRKLATLDGRAAYTILQPYLTSTNEVVLVDRGMIPIDAGEPAPAQAGEVIGVVRKHDKGQGFFDPDNDPARNQWNWWDVETMLENVSAPAGAAVLPIVVQRIPQDGGSGFPIAQMPKAELRNNHLGYAITWFGLAAALAGVTAAFWLRQRKGVVTAPE